MATIRHRSLVERDGRKVDVKDKGLALKKCQHTKISNLKKKN